VPLGVVVRGRVRVCPALEAHTARPWWERGLLTHIIITVLKGYHGRMRKVGVDNCSGCLGGGKRLLNMSICTGVSYNRHY